MWNDLGLSLRSFLRTIYSHILLRCSQRSCSGVNGEWDVLWFLLYTISFVDSSFVVPWFDATSYYHLCSIRYSSEKRAATNYGTAWGLGPPHPNLYSIVLRICLCKVYLCNRTLRYVWCKVVVRMDSPSPIWKRLELWKRTSWWSIDHCSLWELKRLTTLHRFKISVYTEGRIFIWCVHKMMDDSKRALLLHHMCSHTTSSIFYEMLSNVTCMWNGIWITSHYVLGQIMWDHVVDHDVLVMMVVNTQGTKTRPSQGIPYIDGCG